MSEDVTTALTGADKTDDGPERHDGARLRRGTTIGRYIVIDRLGGGGMGDVYSAWDEELRRRVALKLIRARPGADLHGQVLAEARALARLRHPHVVAVHDVGEARGLVFVSMELLEGPNLRDWSEQDEPSKQEVTSVLRQCARGLAAAHAEGIVHHDIKPSNVVIEPGPDGPRAALIDFGLASGTGSDPAAVGGTLAYMAPERRAGGVGGPASDQWSLALMTAELLGGQRPTLEEAVAGDLRGCGAATASLRRALDDSPARRFEDVSAFEAATLRPSRARAWRWMLPLGLSASLGLGAWGLHAARPSCEAKAEIRVESRLGGTAVLELLGSVREQRPAVGEPMLDHFSAWRDAWQEDLAQSCRRGEAQRSCREQQLVTWAELLAAASSSETPIEGGWALLAEAARVSISCTPRAPAVGAELARARVLELAHRPDEAFEAAQSALESTAEASAEQAPVLSRMASLERARDHFDASLDLADRAMLLAARHEDAHTLARTALDRVLTLVAAGQFKQAEDAARVARSLVAGAGDSPDLLSGWLSVRGRVSEVGFRFEAAIEAYAEGLELARESASGSVYEADALADLGEALSRVGRCGEALGHLESALLLYRVHFGRASPPEAQVLQSIGMCKADVGNPDAALQALRRSESILAETLGPGSLERAFSLVLVGDVLNGSGRSVEAVEPYTAAAEIKRAVLGEGHRETVIAMVHLGWHQASLGNLDGAREHLEPALAAAEALEELDDVDWMQIHGARAALLEAEGDLEGALNSQMLSVERLRAGLADMPQAWVEPLTNLGSLQARSAQPQAARRSYLEARRIAARSLGGESAAKLRAIDEALAELPAL